MDGEVPEGEKEDKVAKEGATERARTDEVVVKVLRLEITMIKNPKEPATTP